jgi:molybdate transport system ATP-binding protein
MVEFSIQKRLGGFLLDVQGAFREGVVGVFGESGSGKSTLLKCLCGFLTPDRGEIRVGQQVHFSSQRRINVPVEERQTGMVFQEGLLFPHLSVEGNILYGRRRSTPVSYIDEVTGLTNLADLRERRINSLSGGEQQRVALARALIHQPSLLLMDEPLSSVDMKARYQIVFYLRQIYERLRIPIVYVSHSITEMLALVHHVLVLEKGKAVAYGQPMKTLADHRVWPMIREEDIENIYELPVISHQVDKSMVTVDWGGHALCVAYSGQSILSQIRIGIKAKDIIVSLHPFKGMSARNQIPAVIVERLNVSQQIVLVAKINSCRCLVEVTEAAYQEMGLAEASQVHLIIKATSIHIL